MSKLSTMRGYYFWGKNKGLNQKDTQQLLKDCQKDLNIDLRINEVFYSNNQKKVERQKKNFNKFCQWYSSKFNQH